MKRIPASSAKNNFGGLLEDVAALGMVEIVRHGRPVAVVMSPRQFSALDLHKPGGAVQAPVIWGENHMIPPELAREASVVHLPDYHEDEE